MAIHLWFSPYYLWCWRIGLDEGFGFVSAYAARQAAEAHIAALERPP